MTYWPAIQEIVLDDIMAHLYDGIEPIFRIEAQENHKFIYSFIRGGIGDRKVIFEYESKEYIGLLNFTNESENKNELKINLLKLMKENNVIFSKYSKKTADEGALLTFKDIINHPKLQNDIETFFKLNKDFKEHLEESEFHSSLKIDYNNKKYFKLDSDELQVLECEIKQNADGTYHLIKPFIDAFPDELHIIQSPLLDRNIKYNIIWKSKSAGYSVPTEGNPKTIINQLSDSGLILNDYKSHDKFAFILSYMRKEGFMEKEYGIQESGFHWLDGEIISVKYNCDELPDPKDLKKSLKTLEDFGNYFKTQEADIRDKLATIFKLTLITPFDYVKKQLGYDREIPFLYGAPGTAKTTILQLPKFVYNIPNDYYMESGGAAGTKSQLSGLMKESTFPKMIDEAENIFKDPELAALNKQSLNNLYSRKIRDTNQNEKIQPSYSTLLYNSNQSPFKHSQNGSVRRYQIINFDETEKPSEDEKTYFKETWKASDKGHYQKDTPLKYLKHIGKFVAFKIVNNPDLLKKEVKSLTDSLIDDMYTFAGNLGGPAPWLKSWCEVEDEKSFKEMENENITYFLRKSIEDAHKYKIQAVNEDYKPENTFENETAHGPEFYYHRMDEVANNPALAWFDKKNIMGAEYYLINLGILNELHKKTDIKISLSELSKRFGIFELKSIRPKNKNNKGYGKPMKSIRVLKKDFGKLVYGHLEKLNED